jgi:hypothetical protein
MATKKKRPVKELPFMLIAEELIKTGRLTGNGKYLKKYIKDIEFKFGLCNCEAKDYRAAIDNFSKCGEDYCIKYILYIVCEYTFFKNIIKNRSVFKDNSVK